MVVMIFLDCKLLLSSTFILNVEAVIRVFSTSSPANVIRRSKLDKGDVSDSNRRRRRISDLVARIVSWTYKEEEGTGVTSDVVKVEGEDPSTPGPLS